MIPILLTNGEGGVGVQATVEALACGRSAMDAIEAGIRLVEGDPRVHSVGLNSPPNVLGEMECDAAVMCGDTLRTGAVGALKGHLHAFSVARRVLERTPHVMLVGEGAARFACETGEPRAEVLSDEARAAYHRWLDEHLPAEHRAKWPEVPLCPLVWQTANSAKAGGTTIFLARGTDGHWCGGTSTSGWAYKYPGRLGDSPIIGAGLYIDDRYGGAACTHTGEMTIRAGTARAIVAYMKRGAAVAEACHDAVADLHSLRGGHLGPVVIHAVDREGVPHVVSTGLPDGAPHWFWQQGMPHAEKRWSVVVS
jgi:L-asparaginase